MNIKNRKQTYLTIGILAAVAAVLGGAVINQQQIAANEITTTLIDYTVDLPPGLPDPIVMKKGQTRVIPLTIMAPIEKPLNVKVGVVAEGEEAAFTGIGQENLPIGISATIDKREVNLPAQAGQGLANRGTILLMKA